MRGGTLKVCHMTCQHLERKGRGKERGGGKSYDKAIYIEKHVKDGKCF